MDLRYKFVRNVAVFVRYVIYNSLAFGTLVDLGTNKWTNSIMIYFQDISEYPLIAPLKSYGRGRDAPGGRYASLVFGTNLTDVVITGNISHFVFVYA